MLLLPGACLRPCMSIWCCLKETRNPLLFRLLTLWSPAPQVLFKYEGHTHTVLTMILPYTGFFKKEYPNIEDIIFRKAGTYPKEGCGIPSPERDLPSGKKHIGPRCGDQDPKQNCSRAFCSAFYTQHAEGTLTGGLRVLFSRLNCQRPSIII